MCAFMEPCCHEQLRHDGEYDEFAGGLCDMPCMWLPHIAEPYIAWPESDFVVVVLPYDSAFSYDAEFAFVVHIERQFFTAVVSSAPESYRPILVDTEFEMFGCISIHMIRLYNTCLHKYKTFHLKSYFMVIQ